MEHPHGKIQNGVSSTKVSPSLVSTQVSLNFVEERLWLRDCMQIDVAKWSAVCLQFTGKYQDHSCYKCVANISKQFEATYSPWRRQFWKGMCNLKLSSISSFNVHALISGLESRSRKYLRLWWNSFGSRKNNERKGSRQREIWSPPRNADHAKNWTSSKCCHFIGSLYW